MRLLITILVAVGALGAGSYVALSLWRSVGWWRSQVGQNLMAMAAVLFGLLTLLLAGRVLHPGMWVWIAGLSALDAVLWWRVVILWHLQRKQEGGE